MLARTALYACGTLIVLLLEKTVAGSDEHGGLIPSLLAVSQHADVLQVLPANAWTFEDFASGGVSGV